jgi:hypothetical protein
MTEATPQPKIEPTGPPSGMPEGIRNALAAFRRDLPTLLASWRARGKWACYSKDGQVGIGRSYLKLMDEVVRRGIPDGEYIIDRVTPGAGSEEEEEIDSFGV